MEASTKPLLKLKATAPVDAPLPEPTLPPELAPIKPRPQVLPTARGIAKEAAKFMRYEFERDNPEAVLLIEAMNKNLEVAFTFVDGTIIKSRVAAYGKYNIGLEDGGVIYKVGLKSIKICEATDA